MAMDASAQEPASVVAGSGSDLPKGTPSWENDRLCAPETKPC
jgi:hypothetical protein